MNETKKVNEISSKKNFGKYSKKIHRRNDKAITLIALIVTIIVLLILVGVTINLALNNQGIFNKAKTATRAFKNAEEGEQSGLDVADREIAKYMPKGTSEGGNGSESSGGASEAGQVYIPINGGVGFYAQSNGKLYSFNCTTTYYDKDFDLTYIRDDIKNFYGLSGAYLTNSNELYKCNYKYNYNSYQYEKVGDNVKEYYDASGAYLTNTNELYQYNGRSNQYEKVGENVKKHYDDRGVYLTNSNELYKYNSSSNQYEKVGDNVKELKERYYITNSNEIYAYNDDHNVYEKIEVNVDDIKEFGEDYFITKNNKIRVWIVLDE